MMASSMAAPEANRRVIKLAASIEPAPRAMRVSKEFAAKAISVHPVRITVLLADSGKLVVGLSSELAMPLFYFPMGQNVFRCPFSVAQRPTGFPDELGQSSLF